MRFVILLAATTIADAIRPDWANRSAGLVALVLGALLVWDMVEAAHIW